MENYKKYEVYYPAELETENKKYPVIIVNNGTGVKGSKAKTMFEHFASWGGLSSSVMRRSIPRTASPQR